MKRFIDPINTKYLHLLGSVYCFIFLNRAQSYSHTGKEFHSCLIPERGWMGAHSSSQAIKGATKLKRLRSTGLWYLGQNREQSRNLSCL